MFNLVVSDTEAGALKYKVRHRSKQAKKLRKIVNIFLSNSLSINKLGYSQHIFSLRGKKIKFELKIQAFS